MTFEINGPDLTKENKKTFRLKNFRFASYYMILLSKF